MEHLPGNHYPVLVPNMKGLENLLALLADANPPSSRALPSTPPLPAAEPLTDEIAVFTAATDAFCKANTNCTIAQSLERLAKVTETALKRGLRVRGCVMRVALGSNTFVLISLLQLCERRRRLSVYRQSELQEGERGGTRAPRHGLLRSELGRHSRSGHASRHPRDARDSHGRGPRPSSC